MAEGWRYANQHAVPLTGTKYGRRRYRFMRLPRNAAVKRALAADGMHGEKLPPSDWDDLPRCIQRTWKEHRSTQWRVKTWKQEKVIRQKQRQRRRARLTLAQIERRAVWMTINESL